ncbi:hypothetical protein AX774_g10 [Zancudomyces culisetae]|uniref:Uncharacterized protein n=1 Tax=Zancudomyces culisetae TaxID=1213189 RepID=A0A1R1PZQ6_ZANCU|nr:hypothetical protein AX774_g10 [Zancudomyces culisetae]|eukprot:OMH86422.1 hypothetical protein AX774_g10 [Zancudomyces culisetae]
MQENRFGSENEGLTLQSDSNWKDMLVGAGIMAFGVSLSTLILFYGTRLTTINWEPLKRVLNSRPMFCVCDKSSAASISSRMYIGAGLNCKNNSASEFRQISPRLTLMLNPSVILSGLIGSSRAVFPGSSSAKIPPKSTFTCPNVLVSASYLYFSSVLIVSSILRLSFNTVLSFCFNDCSRFSTFSIFASTDVFVVLRRTANRSEISRRLRAAAAGSRFAKSNAPPGTPNRSFWSFSHALRSFSSSIDRCAFAYTDFSRSPLIAFISLSIASPCRFASAAFSIFGSIPEFAGLDPPCNVPDGSYTSPSYVTALILILLLNATRLAVSVSGHTIVFPNTYCIAACTCGLYSTKSSANRAFPSVICAAIPTSFSPATAPLILFNGMNVTRLFNRPCSSNFAAVVSESTTTFINRPPAVISSAFIASILLGSTRISCAILPYTLRRSNPGSGSLYSNSAPVHSPALFLRNSLCCRFSCPTFSITWLYICPLNPTFESSSVLLATLSSKSLFFLIIPSSSFSAPPSFSNNSFSSSFSIRFFTRLCSTTVRLCASCFFAFASCCMYPPPPPPSSPSSAATPVDSD